MTLNTIKRHDLSKKSGIITPINNQTYLEINSSAFNHNVAYYKNKIGQQNSLAAVIKGNGYGHGLMQIALLCEQSEHINWVCVAQLSEALSLQNIVTKPILVLGYSDVNPEYAAYKNIHFMIDHVEYAQNLNEIGKKYRCQFNVHVKIDTGLSRMGVMVEHADDFIQQLKQLPYITIAGIYSHFSASDTNPEFTQHQFIQYNRLLDQLSTHMSLPAYIHMSNSASISTVKYPERFNFFRVGLGIYGFGPDRVHLQPVMTWKTHIVNSKIVPAGSYISYAGSYKTTRHTRIALLPVGYYDGYDFRFSNKAFVLINGQYAPVIGRIAMNITIIDITDIKAEKNDEAILIGQHEKVDLHYLTALAEIKNVREIITGINAAIVRIIVP